MTDRIRNWLILGLVASLGASAGGAFWVRSATLATYAGAEEQQKWLKWREAAAAGRAEEPPPAEAEPFSHDGPAEDVLRAAAREASSHFPAATAWATGPSAWRVSTVSRFTLPCPSTA